MKKKEGKTIRRKAGKDASRDVEKLNGILIENFVNLQKAMTNLAIKFDRLSEQISSLLQLFEISAKSFADKLAVSLPEVEKDREFLEKLDKLLEQNKVIAKGLTLMEEKLRERLYGHSTPARAEILRHPQMLQQQAIKQQPSEIARGEGYMHSLDTELKKKFPPL